MNNYNPLPASFVSGEGSWLIDNQGDRYLDALSGSGLRIGAFSSIVK